MLSFARALLLGTSLIVTQAFANPVEWDERESSSNTVVRAIVQNESTFFPKSLDVDKRNALFRVLQGGTQKRIQYLQKNWRTITECLSDEDIRDALLPKFFSIKKVQTSTARLSALFKHHTVFASEVPHRGHASFVSNLLDMEAGDIKDYVAKQTNNTWPLASLGTLLPVSKLQSESTAVENMKIVLAEVDPRINHPLLMVARNPEGYLGMNPDLQAMVAGKDGQARADALLNHYLINGQFEGRFPDALSYVASFKDLAEAWAGLSGDALVAAAEEHYRTLPERDGESRSYVGVVFPNMLEYWAGNSDLQGASHSLTGRAWQRWMMEHWAFNHQTETRPLGNVPSLTEYEIADRLARIEGPISRLGGLSGDDLQIELQKQAYMAPSSSSRASDCVPYYGFSPLSYVYAHKIPTDWFSSIKTMDEFKQRAYLHHVIHRLPLPSDLELRQSGDFLYFNEIRFDLDLFSPDSGSKSKVSRLLSAVEKIQASPLDGLMGGRVTRTADLELRDYQSARVPGAMGPVFLPRLDTLLGYAAMNSDLSAAIREKSPQDALVFLAQHMESQKWTEPRLLLQGTSIPDAFGYMAANRDLAKAFVGHSANPGGVPSLPNIRESAYEIAGLLHWVTAGRFEKGRDLSPSVESDMGKILGWLITQPHLQAEVRAIDLSDDRGHLISFIIKHYLVADGVNPSDLSSIAFLDRYNAELYLERRPDLKGSVTGHYNTHGELTPEGFGKLRDHYYKHGIWEGHGLSDTVQGYSVAPYDETTVW